MLLTIKEVSERLKISLSKVYALVARGDLACYEIGSCKRISEEDLKLFLDQRRRVPPRYARRRNRR